MQHRTHYSAEFKANVALADISGLKTLSKYERIYLKAYETRVELSNDLTTWFSWYNEKRKHSSLDKRIPDEAYFQGIEQLKLAA